MNTIETKEIKPSELDSSAEAVIAARQIHYTDVSSTAAFDRSQREQRHIAKIVDRETNLPTLPKQRDALKEALGQARKSIEGLARLVGELRTAQGEIGVMNAITIGAYLGEAEAANNAIEKALALCKEDGE